MLSLLRPLLKISLYLFIFLAIAGGVLFLVIDPNNFKANANDILKKYTGYNFEILGSINWSLSPLAFEAQNIKLESPAIEIKRAKATVELSSLLGNRIVIENLDLDGITAATNKIVPFNLNSLDNATIKSLVITNSVFTLKDETGKQSWELRNCNANTKNLDSLNLTGTLVNLTQGSSFEVNTVVSMNAQDQTITLDPLNLNWNDAKAHGTALISQASSNQSITGDVTLEPTSLDSILKKLDP